MSKISHRDLVGTHTTRNEPQTLAVPTLRKVIAEAQSAQRYYSLTTPGFSEPRMVSKPAASMRTLTLADTAVGVDRNGKIAVGGAANNSGETISIAEAIFRGSRFAQAGGNIEFWPHLQPKITGPEGVMSLVEQPRFFSVVNPGSFELIDDDADQAVSEIPLYLADISRAGQRSYGICYHLTRAQQKARGEEQTAAELMTAIFTGISRIVDKLAIEAILANTPSAFSIAEASAAGVRIADLRGLIGTAGNSASWRGDGVFSVAGGIPAEVTNVTTETIVGDFSRALAVVGPDLTIMATRLTVAGDVTVSAWLSVDAVCPAAGRFWTVSA